MSRPTAWDLFNAGKTLDITAEPNDSIEVELSDRGGLGKVLYIHVNGTTVLRICRLNDIILMTKGF